MRIPALLIAAVFGAVTVTLWALANQPVAEPKWPQRIQGFAFSPYHSGQDAVAGDFPSVQQIEGDLVLLKDRTRSIRTYTTDGTIGQVPALAKKHQIKVALGAWIDARFAHNASEIERAIRLARSHDNVIRLIVGNEVVLRGDIPLSDLTAYLDRVRTAVKQPVSTAEPWHVWLRHPELAEHVDYLAVHMLPYWEGVSAEASIGYIDAKVAELEAAFPGKKIVLAEVGWPSNGRTREAAVASESNEAMFLRRFLSRAREQGYVYYLMEAFDQPWKAQSEGSVGAYWGVWNVDREAKFPFKAPIVRIPEWRTLAAIAVALALIMLTVFSLDGRRLANSGRSFLAVVAYATATTLVWVLYEYSQQYMTVTTVIVGLLLLVGTIGVIAVLLAEAHEWAEAQWATARRQLLVPAGEPASPVDNCQKVSIHVPCYNEPPAMVIETLDALARLDWPDFEVLVIDNNTPDEAVWKPVEAHCATLGPRFRFFHVSPLAGFKAGALNFALRNTDPAAEIVAVIDSDYVVRPEWLRDMLPAFADPKLAIAQAPQDYRDAAENAFKASCYAEYAGFFHIGMVTRNERNAIIQHGTMTLVRRTALESASGWSEWCITEDAELGLRLFEQGWTATYLPRSYGRGLMPDTFNDFRKQRFRWAYGAMQILRRHAGVLFRWKDRSLTSGQRYHFLAGWLPWVADGINLLFNLAALGWSIGMIMAPSVIDPPLLIFSVLPLSLFAFKAAKLIDLYRTCVGARPRQIAAAALAGLGLSHTVGVATLSGLVTTDKPFFRTPKQAERHALLTALSSAREEWLMTIALLLAAWGVSTIEAMGSPDLSVWIMVLLVQTVPYLAAILMSLASALPLPARLIGTPKPTRYQAPASASEAAEIR
ncbi:MAG: glycosyltransferase [Gammaproteobacteria bacterium]|jgi:exo-beta-1,3-glucanase (GH17 family)/cellulose synthase/poly-beta-1,6-N-acetylglucosamine synthase-like glycosyltransferase|nr:glycosyltransferase [Gammaproteobacteria bacterium]